MRLQLWSRGTCVGDDGGAAGLRQSPRVGIRTLGRVPAAAVFGISLAWPSIGVPRDVLANSTTCPISVDYPHWSTGTPGSVVAKTRYTCSVSSASVSLNMLLYYCASNPPAGPESAWASEGCEIVASNPDTTLNPPAGVEQTRQVAFGPPAHSGWYVACTVYTVNPDYVNSRATEEGMVPSSPNYL
jgi:hypothetical protein